MRYHIRRNWLVTEVMNGTQTERDGGYNRVPLNIRLKKRRRKMGNDCVINHEKICQQYEICLTMIYNYFIAYQ